MASSPDISPEARWASPALQALDNWLVNKNARYDVLGSASLLLWMYQGFEVIPILGHALPIGLNARLDSAGLYRIKAFLPEDDLTSYQRRLLTIEFFRAVDNNRPGLPIYDISFIATSDEVSFESQIKKAAESDGGEFLGVFVDDLEADIKITEGLFFGQYWIEAPNAALAGETPKSLFGTPNEESLRRMVLNRMTGGVS